MSTGLTLAINPGSTSTKIGVYHEKTCVFEKTIRHSAEELSSFFRISDQFDFRKKKIVDVLVDKGISPSSLDIIVGRGGLIKPVSSGVYEVSDALADDLKAGVLGEHASNLGGLIARDFVKENKYARAFIADPIVVDELEPVARISGHPLFERRSIFHALNQKAIAKRHAEEMGLHYNELNLIVAHLGGGISVGAHRKGKVIDVNQGLDGEGPFSPERSGTLPVGQLVEMCYSGEYSKDEIKKMIKGKGGYVAYLGTNDAQEVEAKIETGDEKCALVKDALIYQVAKEIGAMSTALSGQLDGILLTGGLVYGEELIKDLEKRICHLGPVFVYPGEDELKALAYNGWLVSTGQVAVKSYEESVRLMEARSS